jgi:pimeloyl-ACP methyl ester carboxylesterase
VPLDYAHQSAKPSVAIALTRLPALVPPQHPRYKGPVLINPGGPGGSGVELVLSRGAQLQSVVGRTHDVVGFDPRGVNNTTPATTCFQTRGAREGWFLRGSGGGVAEGWGRSLALGMACSEIAGDGVGFVGSWNVVRDLISIVDAHFPGEKRGVRYWGFSYGSVLGLTLASLFPDRVERVVVDGIVDLRDYYAGRWEHNLQDMDRVVGKFFEGCVDAGPERCGLFEPTPSEVEARVERLLAKVKAEPVPVLRDNGEPDWVTDGDARTAIFEAVYKPIERFPAAADALAALEKGDGRLVVGMLRAPSFTCPSSPSSPSPPNTGSEAAMAISCQDGAAGRFASVHEFEEYLGLLRNQSSWAAVNWATIRLTCAGWDIAPRGLGPRGETEWWGGKTKAPVLFLSNELDPVTPLRNARRMRRLFPGAGLMVQSGGAGHCSISAPSACGRRVVEKYFEDGVAAKAGEEIVCEVDQVPWGEKKEVEGEEKWESWSPRPPRGLW